MICLILSCNQSNIKPDSQESKNKNKSSSKSEEYKKPTAETRKAPEDDDWNNNIYNNTFYKFKIEFPKEWEYDNGASKNTLARAGNREIGASFSLQVIHLVELPVNPNDINESLTINEIKSITNSTYLPFKDIGNVKIEKGYLGNLPAYLLEFTHRVSSGQRTFIYLTKQIQCYKNSKLFQITLNIPKDSFDDGMTILNERVINSFIFF